MVEIIDKKEFLVAALNANNKTFTVHIVAQVEPTIMQIYFSHQAKVISLTSEEIRIPTKYFNFSNVFSSDSTVELLEYTRINNYSINLLDNKQPPYGLI